MTAPAGSVRGSAGSCSAAARGSVAVRDRGGGGGVGDEGDPVAEVRGEPRRGLAALLGPDPADDQLADALLVSSCRRLVVVNALCEVLVTPARRARPQPVHQRTSPRAGSNAPPVPGSACSTQMTSSPRSRAVHQPGDLAGDGGVGAGRPQRPLPERFLDVDDEKSTSHDDKHPAGTDSRVRPDQVPNRTDPVTSWLSQTPRAASSERAGLIAAISIVNYLAFGLPALIAGIATTHFGLHDTALVYSVVIALLAVAAAGGFLFEGNARTRAPRAVAPPPELPPGPVHRATAHASNAPRSRATEDITGRLRPYRALRAAPDRA